MSKELIGAAMVVLLLVGLLVFLSVRYNRLGSEYDIVMLNNKAYESQLDVVVEENKVFQFCIELLEYINDSTIRELDSLRKELKIKDSKIKQMGKIKEYIFFTNTVTVHDTIFSKEGFCLDTTLGDEWYTNNLHLEYPNVISSTIDINTDQSCFLYTTREPVKAPCKTWMGRLFQKKHDVYNVTVTEHNPYARVKENKFIIINK